MIWIQGGSSAGGNTNRLITSAGMPGNMQYNSSRRGTQIYANGIAFADPYNGNGNSDAGWIRHIEESTNGGYLEIAVGDDASGENIYLRQYNTSNGIAKSINVFSDLITTSNISSQNVSYANSAGSAATADSPYGFSFSNRASSDWTGVTGTFITDWHHSSGADVMFKYNGGALNIITDGYFYQGIDYKGASYRVADVNDLASYSLTSHTHSYLISSGFTSSGSTSLSTWGTITANNGYKGSLNIGTSDGGAWEIGYKGGQIFQQIDGYYYQNEGRYRVLDTSDFNGTISWGNVSGKPGASGNATTPVYWNGSGFTNCTAYGSASVNYANSAGTISGNFVFTNSDVPEGAANLSAAATAHSARLYRNGILFPYQMDNTNDGGMMRVRGTSESNCVLELATWDDSGAGETIQFNYYPTTSQINPTYSVSVPKKSGTIALTSDISWSNVTSKPAASGNATTPVYWNGSGFTNCTAYASASVNYAASAGSVVWDNVSSKPNFGVYWNGYPFIRNDGVIEIGKYIDFHASASDTSDYCFRLTAASGSLTGSGSFYANSDRHKKKHVQSIDRRSLSDLFDASDKLLKKFTWKQSSKVSYGFIAQQLEKYIPEAVSQDNEGIKSVSYDIAYAKIIAALVHKVKEQANAIEEIKSMLSAIS